MAASENTVKVLEYCKNHVGVMITHDTLATVSGLKQNSLFLQLIIVKIMLV